MSIYTESSESYDIYLYLYLLSDYIYPQVVSNK